MSELHSKQHELTNDNLRILVCCHKVCSLPKDPHLVPVLGGAVNHETVPDNFYCDNQVDGSCCDNISDKNATYCELTCMYWAWKHLKKIIPAVEYIGLNHYRRYFDFSGKYSGALGHSLPADQVEDYHIDVEAVKHFMGDFDIVLAQKCHYPYALYQQYSIEHVSDDARRIVAIVHQLHPEVDDSMYKVFMRGNTLSPCNMFIMPFDLFDEYSKWLFGILEVAEQRIDLSGYSPRQARIFGFLAERLMNVWVDYKGLRVKYAPIVSYGDIHYNSPIKNTVKSIKLDFAYHMSRPFDINTRDLFDSFTNYWSE